LRQAGSGLGPATPGITCQLGVKGGRLFPVTWASRSVASGVLRQRLPVGRCRG
jgi:hypothetical protein